MIWLDSKITDNSMNTLGAIQLLRETFLALADLIRLCANFLCLSLIFLIYFAITWLSQIECRHLGTTPVIPNVCSADHQWSANP